MITAIEIPKGYESPKLRSVVTAKTGRRYLIFDPTWDKTPFGQLESNLQGSYGVLMEGKESQVIELADPRSGTEYDSADGEVSAAGGWVAEGGRNGQEVWRSCRDTAHCVHA